MENVLPVEYYSELSGVMVDSAVILDNIKRSLTNLYQHLKHYKIDICLNNVIFKWLVTLFFENTDESIYTPVMDSLLLYGDITLYKASILILFFEQNNILKCNNLCDASIYFDQNLRLFKNKKFSSYLLSKDLFDLNIDDINKLRANKFPKIKDNIKQINEFESKKKKKESDTTCNKDWPYCVKLLGSTTINDVIKHKLYEKPLIEEDYFDYVKHNVYKLAEDGKDEHKNYLKNLENEKDDMKKRTVIYGNLLMERPFHKCEKNFSSRKEILRDNSGKRSSLMGTFFQSFKKENNKNNKISNSEEELMNIMSYKNEIDHNTFIENIMDNPNNDESEGKENIDELKSGSWFKKMPLPKDD